MIRTLGIWALLAAICIPSVIFLNEYVKVENCADRGGSFDYEKGFCDLYVSHPFIPFELRHRQILFLGGIVGITSIVLLILSRRWS